MDMSGSTSINLFEEKTRGVDETSPVGLLIKPTAKETRRKAQQVPGEVPVLSTGKRSIAPTNLGKWEGQEMKKALSVGHRGERGRVKGHSPSTRRSKSSIKLQGETFTDV